MNFISFNFSTFVEFLTPISLYLPQIGSKNYLFAKDYRPLLLIPSDYIELENWLLKNPLTKKRKRENYQVPELQRLIQRAYLLQSIRSKTKWRSVLKAMKECSVPWKRFEPPRSLVPTARPELYLGDSYSSQPLSLSTFQKYLSQYRTGKRKITLTN